ncbi:hypothetical protein ATANTOWER_021411 [Ataeniobius toweri]|uniref:Secreted protein n=1 Tax=Ataeniobius toweri TaxID=208326 RepID=A0ABU7ARF5_9TELE|nr:hypothetical protein [Ataeniobius toweri]
MWLLSLTFSSCLFLVKGFPVLTSGIHWSVPGSQASSHLSPNKIFWTTSSMAGKLKAPHFPLSSVQPVCPPTLKPRLSDCSCLIALLIHFAHSDLTLVSAHSPGFIIFSYQ